MASRLWLQAKRAVLRTAVTGTVAVGVVEATTHLPSEGRSSSFYHWMSDDVVTPLLRRTMDPELAHNVALQLAPTWAPTFRPSAVEQGIEASIRPFPNFSLQFDNCLGLAAGFDKDGVAIQAMMDMGFGFVEIGSVTPEPQEGNPKPRMFRLTRDLGVINRYGFNSQGADIVEQNLSNFRNPQSTPVTLDDQGSSQPLHQAVHMVHQTLNGSMRALSMLQRYSPTRKGILGVNLGINKTSDDEIADYQRGIRQLGPYADYLVVNVSSPNTPGLRELQQPDALRNLLTAALDTRNQLDKPIPLLVKLAPDLTTDELKLIAQTIMECGVDGIIVSNTTNTRPTSVVSPEQEEEGGLSGAPLKEISTECIRTLYALTEGNLPIIGVGGVGSGKDAYEKLKAGASLIQIYSMMVYEGPGVVSRIRQELAQLMVQNGQRRLEDVVGLDHDMIYWRKREERRLRKQHDEKTIVEE